ncbi:MAG: threonine ammonia-lyase [Clostridiales bacterium]|nr:threonine ammonia-lyase [Clostridiales bacterium]
MEFKEIQDAAQRLKGVIHKLPLLSSRTFSQLSGAEIYFKCENQQRTGSFKIRGAYNKIAKLTENQDVESVVASSAGNHAQGVAYAAAQKGINSIICMPKSAPLAKIAATKGYGAQVILHGAGFDDAYEKALDVQKETNATFVHAYNDEDIIAGQGTIGIEILQELPTVDAIVVPVGGGGLLSGISFAVKEVCPHVKVIGVQAEGCDPLVRSYKAKSLVNADKSNTIADGIAVRHPGDVNFEIIKNCVDDMVTVTEDEISESVLLLLERSKQAVEPSGAVAVAAMINKKINLPGKKVVCILSGGNIDVGFMNKIIRQGLVARGRMLKLSIVLADQPGALADLAHVVGAANANIVSVMYDKDKLHLALTNTMVHLVCEVSGFDHGKKVMQSLADSGYIVAEE